MEVSKQQCHGDGESIIIVVHPEYTESFAFLLDIIAAGQCPSHRPKQEFLLLVVVAKVVESFSRQSSNNLHGIQQQSTVLRSSSLVSHSWTCVLCPAI
jgi:hypothetical protein